MGPSRYSRSSRLPLPKLQMTTLMVFLSVSERSHERWNHPRAIPPLLGFGLPLHRHTFSASTPKAEASSVRRRQPSNHVPPPWFHTTMTGFSTLKSRACCIPQPIGGSLRFLLPSSEASRRRRRMARGIPRNAVHTLRRFPLASSRTASLRPLPSCRSVALLPFRAPKRPTRPVVRANSHHNLCLSASRSHQSASAASSVCADSH